LKGKIKLVKVIMKCVFATLLILVASSLTACVCAQPSEPHAANALWVEPSSISIDVTQVNVGYKFNVTVWLNLTGDSYTWQVKLLFNSTYFNATGTGYTAGATSEWATHRTGGATVPVTPVIDNTAGYVLHGESCLGENYVPGPIVASLIWVEFQLKEVPPLNHLTLNFSAPYGEDTFVLDPDLNIIQITNISGADIPVITEFPQIIPPLFLLSMLSAAIALKKKLMNHNINM